MEAATATREKQRKEALERANAIRLARAVVKREFAAGASPVPCILEPDDFMAGAKLLEILCSCPKIGRWTARKVCTRAGVRDENKRLGELTDRQRAALVRELRKTSAGCDW